jgi:hypothetical protein
MPGTDEAELQATLQRMREQFDPAFARDTAYAPSLQSSGGPNETPSTGHCAVVAVIVQKRLGGKLLRTTVAGEEHWFNRVPLAGGYVDVDLTGDQFGSPAVQIRLPGELYSGAVEQPIEAIQDEALCRAATLATRAGLGDVAAVLLESRDTGTKD